MKIKVMMKKKMYKEMIIILCCVVCNIIFDISWFKNLNSDVGYWIVSLVMILLFVKKEVLCVYN